MYMEEIDFEYRAQKIGVKIYFYPDARFFHKGAASSNGRQEPILNVFRGFLYFYKKHFSWSKLLFLRCLLAGKAILAMALFTVIGKFRDTALYMRALKIALT